MIAVLGGACSLTGQPLDPEILHRLRRQARVPDEPWHGTTRHEGMGGLVEIRRASASDAPDASPHIVFHGYLHNNPELRTELAQEGRRLAEDASDPVVARAAYEQWGPGFVEKLLGEFALIVWDARRSRLLAARDALGMRDLYFTRRGDVILVASQIHQLLLGTPSLDDLNLDYIADFVASHTSVASYSPIQGVERLQAASCLVAEDGEVRIETYWEVDPEHQIRLPDEAAYAEEFRRLFEEAIERTVRRGGKVWTELSGGLDSSAIAGTAQEMRQRRPGFLPDFAALSMTWPENPDCDEQEWQKVMVEKHDLEWHRVACDHLFFDDAAKDAQYRSEPHFGVLSYPSYRERVALLKGHGVDTVLSGGRAEAVVLTEDPAPIHLADLLRSFRVREFVSELSAWQEAMHEPMLNVVARNAIGPLLNRRRMNLTVDSGFHAPMWIRDDFAERYDLRRRAEVGRMPVRFRSAAAQHQYEILGRSEPFILRGYLPLCVETRHPYLYRPLVEFSMAIPWQVKVRPGAFKWLLRRSMRGTLPDFVRLRATKRGPGPAIYRSLPDRWNQIATLFRDPVLVELGVVDAKKLRQAGELARLGTSKSFGLFLGTLALEVWLRTYFLQETPLRAIA